MSNSALLIETAEKARWDAARARSWYSQQPWPVGCNYGPSTAINQLEMWQAETFDPRTIDRELGWLAGIGMNSMRVFLHDLVWKQDPKGFLDRMERYLDISHGHKIGTMFVFFDSVWHPAPKPGLQQAPRPGVHNSFWVQSPGVAILKDTVEFNRLEDYVSGVVSHFKNDERVQVWDLWNEPDNNNAGPYGDTDIAQGKAEIVLPLLAKSFQWARQANPSQPLTSAIWIGENWKEDQLFPLWKFQLRASDVLSFHQYSSLEITRQHVEEIDTQDRPIICTEYMARGRESTFEAILPYFKEHKIGAYNWGSVAGKTQTIYAWDSWQNPVVGEPPLWFHDIFRADGSAYDEKEIALIKSLTRS